MSQLRSSWEKFSQLMKVTRVLKLSQDELEALRLRRLQSMLLHAYENVPYYKTAWDQVGVRPGDIKKVSDLSRLPMVEKQDVQRDPDAFLARGTKKDACLIQRTTGSSGKPLQVYYSDSDDSYSKAVNMRSFMENGYKPWHRWIFIQDPIWSNRRYIHGSKYFFQRWLKLFNPMDVNVHSSAEEQVSIMREHGCDCLHGYPSSLYIIAKYIEEHGITDIRPKLVVTTGELIPPNMRQYLDSVFGVSLVDFVGTTEFNRIAWECERHEGYHMDADSVVMEIVRDGTLLGYGEEGEMVMTGLYNRTMPLIRYRMKDVGVLIEKPCSCGRSLPLMRQIQGRSDDFLVSSHGRLISPMSVWSVLRHHPCISDYHMLQTQAGSVDLEVIKAAGADSNDILAASRELEEVFQGEISVKVKFVDVLQKDGLRAVQSTIVGDKFGVKQ